MCYFGVVEAPTHEALDGVDGVAWVGDGLTLGQLAHETFCGLRESDNRRDRSTALSRRDDSRLSAFHHCHDGVRRAQVDANDLAHSGGAPRCGLVVVCFG